VDDINDTNSNRTNGNTIIQPLLSHNNKNNTNNNNNNNNNTSLTSSKILAPDTPSPQKRKGVQVIFKSKYFSTSSSITDTATNESTHRPTRNVARNLTKQFELSKKEEDDSCRQNSSLSESFRILVPSKFSSPLLSNRRLSLSNNLSDYSLLTETSSATPIKERRTTGSLSPASVSRDAAPTLRTKFSEKIEKFAFVKTKRKLSSANVGSDGDSKPQPTKKHCDSNTLSPNKFIEID
jgi:hypothetical protein